MDKKNTILGILMMGAAFALMFYQGTQLSEQPQETAPSQQVTTASSGLASATISKPSSSSLFESVKTVQKAAQVAFDETTYRLENEDIAVVFTTRGGAIKNVALKQYPIVQGLPEAFVFNANNSTPALSIAFPDGDGRPELFDAEFRLVSQSADKILFVNETTEGVQIYRGYSIFKNESEGDPYVIHHETRFVNKSSDTFGLKKLFVSMGSLPQTKGDTLGDYLNVGYYNGKDAEFIKIGKFRDSKGFFGFGGHKASQYIEEPVKNLVWGSVKNQFFASVLTPTEPGVGIYATDLDVGNASGENDLSQGITGSVELQLGQIEAGKEKLLGLEFYVGPKEYTRLDALGENQDKVMQFGIFGFISKFLLLAMTAVHKVVPNWGLTIIVVTILIKLALWPLTAVQVRSSKRMAKIQEPLKEIKEKYKDNPQKVQAETLKLFKKYKVNPAAGCLPLLVQLPIFLGLYFMLRTSSELRFANFLWIHDLSLPDTVAYIQGFPINILPLLMGVSMFFQMRMMPSPTTDSMQQKVFQLMPFIFLVFCYSFPSGLVLYWTVQNLLTIVQQTITNRMKDPVDDLELVDEDSKKSKGFKTKAPFKRK